MLTTRLTHTHIHTHTHTHTAAPYVDVGFICGVLGIVLPTKYSTNSYVYEVYRALNKKEIRRELRFVNCIKSIV